MQICHSNNSVLCLIDIQPRLLSAMDQDEQATLINNSAKLIQASQQLELPCLISEQYPSGLGNSHPELLELATGTPVIEKTVFSCYSCDDWREQLQTTQRKQLILAGIEAHICILQTALESHAAGFEVFVVEDAIASRSFNNKFNAIARLRAAGVQITNTESVLFEWLQDAKHPKFKSISKLIS